MLILNVRLRGLTGQTVAARIPCSVGDFRRWIALAAIAKPDRSEFEFIFENPALLLVASSQATSCSGVPVESPDQLVERLKHCLAEGDPLDALMGKIAGVEAKSLEWDPDVEHCFHRYRKSRSSEATVKSLSRFLRLFSRRLLPKKKRPSKENCFVLVNSLFSREFKKQKQKKKRAKFDRGTDSRSNHCAADLIALVNSRLQIAAESQNRIETGKLAAMKQLAYGASHEINNPLANVATRAQNLLAIEDNPENRFQLAVIYEQAMRAHDMISDMMLFAHPPKLERARTDVRLCLADLLKECRQTMTCLSATDVQLQGHVGNNVQTALFDPTQIKVLLKTLIQNGAEASENSQGEILVRAFVDATALNVSVSDTGVGIDDSKRPHIFDPFYSGREAGRGLGFGLSKAWRIAELHGGTLELMLQPEQQYTTTFLLTLPQSSQD